MDDAVLNMYPLSYTVTEEQVREASEWMEYGAGTEEYLIEVPIKKKGTASKVYAKPTVKLTYNNKSSYGTCISFETKNAVHPLIGTTTLQIQYSTKKTSGYKTLQTAYPDQSYSPASDEAAKRLTSGRTYYFRARATKTIGDKKIVGAWSKPIKVKYSKKTPKE